MKSILNTILLALSILIVQHSAFGQSLSSDALQAILKTCSSSRERLDTLLNRNDQYTEVNNIELALVLYNEATKEKDVTALIPALSTISAYYINKNLPDSLLYYLNHSELLLSGSDGEGLKEYYKTVFNARKLQSTDRERRELICDSLIKVLQKEQVDENQYQRAGRLFLTGIISYQLMSVSGNPGIAIGLPYWEEVWKLIQKFPKTTRRNFAGNTITCLLPSYIAKDEKEKLITVSNAYLDLLDDYFSDEHITSRRPYIAKEMPYVICYQGLVDSYRQIGKKKAHEYYLRYRDFIHKNKSSFIRNNNFYYTLSCQHYFNQGDYKTALLYNDSILILKKSGKSIITSHTQLYKKRAEILQHLDKYAEACGVYEDYIKENDSLMQKTHTDKVSEMRIAYEVDKLELERTTILAEKRRNTAYFASIISLLILVVAIHLYRSLQKERQMKKELEKERSKAQESERLKQEFLNSISHEIRTPLNSICGFSEVIATSDEMNPEERKEFLKIINSNKHDLTALIDSMLEVATLDSTVQKLAVKNEDIIAIIREKKTEAETANTNKAIHYTLDLDTESCIVNTNRQYISKVIKELLQNATKFTREGEINIACRFNTVTKELSFSVTDAGCGVPKEMQKYVFDRFFKIDSFGQGTGLGLSLCRLIVEKLDGEINIDSNYTEGTRIVVSIPIS